MSHHSGSNRQVNCCSLVLSKVIVVIQVFRQMNLPMVESPQIFPQKFFESVIMEDNELINSTKCTTNLRCHFGGQRSFIM